MKRSIPVLVLALCWAVCPMAAVAGDAKPEPKPESAAQTAAEKWLALVDAGKYAESWQAAAAHLKKVVNEKKWKQTMAPVRGPLGKVVSRKLKSAAYTKELPGAPEGEYVVVQFDTEFASKKAAVETVTPMKDKDGQWRVSGYFIK